jgi:hypothetical protein
MECKKKTIAEKGNETEKNINKLSAKGTHKEDRKKQENKLQVNSNSPRFRDTYSSNTRTKVS